MKMCLGMFQWRILPLRLYIKCSVKNETEMNHSEIAYMDLFSNVDSNISTTGIQLSICGINGQMQIIRNTHSLLSLTVQAINVGIYHIITGYVKKMLLDPSLREHHRVHLHRPIRYCNTSLCYISDHYINPVHC